MNIDTLQIDKMLEWLKTKLKMPCRLMQGEGL